MEQAFDTRIFDKKLEKGILKHKIRNKNFPLNHNIDIDKAIDIAIRTRQAGADNLDINTETGVAMRRSMRDIDIDSWSGDLAIQARCDYR